MQIQQMKKINELNKSKTMKTNILFSKHKLDWRAIVWRPLNYIKKIVPKYL